MEVHHHPKAPKPHHNKWTHYLWEFLMLFLAITLGFFVENQREHYIEHQRAKVYAASMKANLEVDTNELIQIVRRGTYAARFLDTFLLLASTQEFSTIPTGKLYWYGLFGGYLRGFQSNDATYQQMKGSGSLRYFADPILEQKISDYDQLMRSMQISLEIDHPLYLEVRKLRSQMFDFRYNNIANSVVQRAVYEKYDQAAIDSFIQSNPPLLSTDKILFNEYAELCRSRGIRRHVINSSQALELATEIIVLLKVKFHLE